MTLTATILLLQRLIAKQDAEQHRYETELLAYHDVLMDRPKRTTYRGRQRLWYQAAYKEATQKQELEG